MKQFIALVSIVLFPLAMQAGETVKLRPMGSAYSDVADMGILEPEGVGCGNKSVLLVADTGHGRLISYSLLEGGPQPGVEIRIPQMGYPQRVRMNSSGAIFVLDGRQHRILRISPLGEYIGTVEAEGLPGKAISWIPKNFAIDAQDNLYILDVISSRVLVLNSEGKFQRQISYPQSEGFFSDVAVDAQGTVYLLNSVTAAIYSAAQNADTFSPFVKGLKEYVSFPTALAVDRKHLYVVDQNGGGVVLLSREGTFEGRKLSRGWMEGELRYPSDICLDDKGGVFIADRGNNRVQIFMVVP